MPEEKRGQERVFPRDFQDFSVHLKLADLTMNGKLGNLSEEGMCAIIPGHAPSIVDALQTTKDVKGIIEGPRLKESLAVQGKVIWTDERDLHAQPSRFVGIQFQSPLELPESVVALCLSEEN